MKAYRDWLRDLGYEKARSAVALLPLAFFGIVYLLVCLNGPPAFGRMFGALSLVYLTAFMGVAAECFWGRWFASGIGWSGFMVGIASLAMHGWNPVFVVYGAFHALVVLMLLGPKMAARYDLQAGWRQRFAMDEFGVDRLRKAVTRGSAALPSLIVWALAPREGQGAALLAMGLLLLGLFGLLRLRTWGLLAMAGAAVLAAFALPGAPASTLAMPGGWLPSWTPAAAVWTLLALVPFAGPTVRYLRSSRS